MTARLRELVLQQAVIGAVYPIDVVETGIVMVQGNRVARIEHNDVKHVVHAMFDGGLLPGYSREDNGTFWEYVPDPVYSIAGTVTGRLPSTNPPIANDPKADDPLPLGTSKGPWSVIS